MPLLITRQKLNQILRQQSPIVKAAFLEAFDRIRDEATLRAVAEAIASGDVNEVMSVLAVGELTFRPFDDALQRVYGAAGAEAAAKVKMTFDARSPRSQAWFRSVTGGLIQDLTDELRENIREGIARGATEGLNPRQTARRVRSGLGLTRQQAEWVANARQELASLDTMAGYLDRTKRDGRFDSAVTNAIKRGRDLSADQIERMVSAYERRLIGMRAENLSRTETLSAISQGQFDAADQMIAEGRVDRDAIRYRWDATGDSRTRSSHSAMEGQEVAHGEAFIAPSGARLRYPRDKSLGAPASETINCRCWTDAVVSDGAV